MVMITLNCIYEGLQFAEVSLRIDLIIREYWSKVVAGVELFNDHVILVNFLDGDAEDGRRFGSKVSSSTCERR